MPSDGQGEIGGGSPHPSPPSCGLHHSPQDDLQVAWVGGSARSPPPPPARSHPPPKWFSKPCASLAGPCGRLSGGIDGLWRRCTESAAVYSYGECNVPSGPNGRRGPVRKRFHPAALPFVSSGRHVSPWPRAGATVRRCSTQPSETLGQQHRICTAPQACAGEAWLKEFGT